MSWKFALSLGCIALILLPALAHADSITFSFFASTVAGGFVATTAGVTTSTSGIIAVTGGTATNPIFDPGTLATLATGAAAPVGSFTNANLNGGGGVNFLPGLVAVIDVEVKSVALCASLGNPTGICLTGTENGGTLQAPNAGQGSFQGIFAVNPDSVSPTLLALLGFAPGDIVQVSGSDSLDTSNDSFKNGTQTESANFAGGDVTISVISPVPEPESLLLIGCGLLGMAGMIRRKMIATR